MRLALGIGLALPKGGLLKPAIQFSAGPVSDTSTVGTVAGTASLPSGFTGTAVWSLTNSAGGKYSINSSTGVVTVASALTAGLDSITIAVSGVAPTYAAQTFGIYVSGNQLLADTGSPILADTGSPILTQ